VHYLFVGSPKTEDRSASVFGLRTSCPLFNHTLIYSIRSLIFVILSILCFQGIAQEDKKYIRRGNNLYEKEDFVGAEENYLKALEKNNQSTKADFNLGDAFYKQKKFAEAAQQFQKVAEKTNDKDLKANAYHNLGNSLLQAEKYQESVNAYKQSLKIDPTDDETRYNLAYAKKMLQQQQQQENKDKDKDKKDEDKKEDKKNQEKKDQENKDKSDEKKEGDKDKEQQPQPNQLSKQEAKQMLDALNNQEKKVQAKLKKKKENTQKLNIEKDW
jgi:tetratricopeptide (TPR) repeat protein